MERQPSETVAGRRRAATPYAEPEPAVGCVPSPGVDDPVRRVMAVVGDSRYSGVLVVGDHGSGKSWVLREVRARLRGSAARRDGGLVVRPPEMDEAGFRALLLSMAPDVAAPARSPTARATVAQRRAGGLVTVDDVDLLSRGSLASLEAALDRGTAQLVGAVEEGSAPQVVDRLRPACPLRVVRLAPWGADDLGAYFATRVDTGLLHRQSVRRLLRFSDGNALVLTELVNSGLESGALRHEHGTWFWDGPLRAPPITYARVSEQLNRLDDSVQDVLATAAVVDGIVVDDLVAVFGETPVEQAEDSGVLRVQWSGSTLRASVRPAYADVVGRRLATVRGRRLARGLARAAAPVVGDLQMDETRALALAQLAAAPLEVTVLVQAARAALRRHDPTLAEALLVDHSDDPEAVSVRASALAELGRFEDAAHALEAAETQDGAGPAELSARRTLLRAVDRGAGTVAPDPVADRSVEPEATTPLADAWDGVRLHDAVRASTPDLAQPGVAAVLARAGAQAQLAALDEANRQLGPVVHGTAMAGRTDLLAAWALLGFCHLARGAVPDAEVVGSELCATGLAEDWTGAYRLGALVTGRCAMARGRVRTALARLAEACVAHAGTRVPLYRYSMSQLSLALAMAGRHVEAETVLREARSGEDLSPAALVGLGELAAAESRLVRGLHRAALDTAAAVVASSEQRGHRLVHLLALHLCVRAAPSPQLAERVADAARWADFELAEVYVRHAHAAAAHDERLLGEVAQEYDDRELTWLAAETAAACLAAGGSARTTAWSGRSSRILNRLSAADHVAVPGWWRESSEGMSLLTQRERQVAELAASGQTSPQIAARLHVSPRTVDNHLQHSYRKLGVAHRQELADALHPGGERPVSR